MLAFRNGHSAEELDRLSAHITARVLELPEIGNARVVCTYMHIRSEARTTAIVERLLANQKRVIIPITNTADKTLTFSELKEPNNALQQGTFGIPEPKPEHLHPVPLQDADVILVPGVAWDIRGYRIGYGAGYYDRTINALGKTIQMIGLSYEFQIIDTIPNSRYDQRVNKLTTEKRTIEVNMS